jgi:hypothetical protein
MGPERVKPVLDDEHRQSAGAWLRPPTVRAVAVLIPTVLGLAGCWTAPRADVQPGGEPRLIQAGIPVTSVRDPAIVDSVDAATRTIVVRTPGAQQTSTYKVSAAVSNLGQFRFGDKVQATVAQELSVYVLRDGQLPGPGGKPQAITADARVLSVDTSYRLLTLQYPNGRNETFKVGLDTRLREMEAGNSVVIRPVEAVALRKR